MKVDCIESLKFKRTARKLRPLIACQLVDVATILAGILVRLWQLTARNAPRGNVGRFANEEIAETVGWLGDANELIEILVADGWLEHHSTERLIVHDWVDHCPNFVKGNAKSNGGFIKSELGKPSPPKAVPKDIPNAPPKPSPNDSPKDTPNGDPKGGPTYSSPVNSIQTSSEDFKTVEEDLLKLGLMIAAKVCATARENGLTVDHVQEIIAYWEANRPAWDLGALAFRIERFRPTQLVEEGWPAKSREFEVQQADARREHEHSEKLARKRADDAASELQDCHIADLEVEFGPQIDALTKDEVRAATIQFCGDSAEILIANWNRKGRPMPLPKSMHRQLLLEGISTMELNGAV